MAAHSGPSSTAPGWAADRGDENRSVEAAYETPYGRSIDVSGGLKTARDEAAAARRVRAEEHAPVPVSLSRGGSNRHSKPLGYSKLGSPLI